MNVKEFHKVVKDAARKLQEDTGAYVGIVTVLWHGDGSQIREISTSMGSSTKYAEVEGPNKDNGTDD